MLSDDNPLSPAFCWTKFGTEAGDEASEIRARKERERRAGGGVFYWGIGNSIAPSLRILTRLSVAPEVVFTPMLSRPAAVDVSPGRVVAWRGGQGLDGRKHEVRSGVVTSRAPGDMRPQRHFALVCASDDDLEKDLPPAYLDSDRLVNLRTGSRVGSSQVTSVVRQDGRSRTGSGRRYRIAFRARLVAPYFLVLTDVDGDIPGGDQRWAS